MYFAKIDIYTLFIYMYCVWFSIFIKDGNLCATTIQAFVFFFILYFILSFTLVYLYFISLKKTFIRTFFFLCFYCYSTGSLRNHLSNVELIWQMLRKTKKYAAKFHLRIILTTMMIVI